MKLEDVLAGDVWLCVGSDNLALSMSGLANSSAEISSSLNFTSVRFAQLREAWTEEPQVRSDEIPHCQLCNISLCLSSWT